MDRQFRAPVGVFRTDGGGEYASHFARDYFQSRGIRLENSAPYSPQQNGKAERMNRTLMEMARCLLIEAQLPKKHWVFAIKMGAYIHNRRPCKANPDHKTPNEILASIYEDLVTGDDSFQEMVKTKGSSKMLINWIIYNQISKILGTKQTECRLSFRNWTKKTAMMTRKPTTRMRRRKQSNLMRASSQRCIREPPRRCTEAIQYLMHEQSLRRATSGDQEKWIRTRTKKFAGRAQASRVEETQWVYCNALVRNGTGL